MKDSAFASCSTLGFPNWKMVSYRLEALAPRYDQCIHLHSTWVAQKKLKLCSLCSRVVPTTPFRVCPVGRSYSWNVTMSWAGETTSFVCSHRQNTDTYKNNLIILKKKSIAPFLCFWQGLACLLGILKDIVKQNTCPCFHPGTVFSRLFRNPFILWRAFPTVHNVFPVFIGRDKG